MLLLEANDGGIRSLPLTKPPVQREVPPSLREHNSGSASPCVTIALKGFGTMKQILSAGLFMLASFGICSAAPQDWYHDRDARFQGEQWRAHVFEHVRADLDHIGSAAWARGRERVRLDRTRQELSDLQMKLENHRYDEHELNDVIDSVQKSANDQRLAPRDRDVLHDDLNRLRDYREHHEHWNH